MASILITGTSSGIGLATALAFARAGHTVHATMRNPGRAPELPQIAATENDEEWVDWGALDDDAWYRRVQSDFGMDARPRV